LVYEKFCGVLDGGVRFRGCGAECGAFQNSDAEGARVDFILRRSGTVMQERRQIWTGHDFVEQTDVGMCEPSGRRLDQEKAPAPAGK